VHSLIRCVNPRRAAGVAAALVVAGGLAGTTLMAGTAHAAGGPVIFPTSTSITAATQIARLSTHLSCPAAVNAGQSGNCTLTVSNKGRGTAGNVTAEIVLPAALHARYCGTQWRRQGCWLHDNDAIAKFGHLASRQVKSLTVHFAAQGQRGSQHSRLVTVTGSASWDGPLFERGGPMQRITFSTARVEIRPRGFVF
jgi:hypothetical protein